MSSRSSAGGFAHVQTVSSDLYYPPNVQETTDALQRVKLPSSEASFAADIANMAIGGKVLPRESWLPYYETSARDRFQGDPTVLHDYVDSAIEQADACAAFLRSADLTRAPGISPLNKAMLAIKWLYSQDETGSPNGGSPGSLGGRCTDTEGENLGKRFGEVLSSLEGSPEDLQEMLVSSAVGGDEDEDEDEDEATLNMETVSLESLSEIARLISKSTMLSTKKIQRKQDVPHGNLADYRPLRNLKDVRDITKRSMVQLALGPVGRAKLVTGRLVYRQAYEIFDKKRYLYGLFDQSGSMGTDSRRGTMLGCLAALTRAVALNDAELHVRYFDGGVSARDSLCTPEEVKPFWARHARRALSLGGTRIDNAIRTAVQDILETLNKGQLPELLIVTDGEDHTSLTQQDLGPIKLHCIQIGSGGSEQLHQLVYNNNGMLLRTPG